MVRAKDQARTARGGRVMDNEKPTKKEVDSLLDYDKGSGVFRWKKNTGKARKEEVAGSVNHSGYILIGIKGKQYRAHRLAWLMTYGEWPNKHIDHINCNRSDNRICNLRLCSQEQNLANSRKPAKNSSGYKGVSWCKFTDRWRATIRHNGKSISLGRFDCPEEAHRAYCENGRQLKGEFFRGD